MQKQRYPDDAGIYGYRHGDLTAEDDEGAPADYYEEGEEALELSPDDPDYDLSEAAGYADYEPRIRRFPWPQWLMVALSLLLILALLLPVILRAT